MSRQGCERSQSPSAKVIATGAINMTERNDPPMNAAAAILRARPTPGPSARACVTCTITSQHIAYSASAVSSA